MKNNSLIILLIFVLSLLMTICIGFMIFGINNKVSFGGKYTKKEYLFEEEISKIKTSLTDTDVEVRKYDGNKVNVIYQNKGKNKEIDVHLNDNILEISDKGLSNFCFGFCFFDRKVTIYVPNDYKGSFDLDTKSGDIEILNNFNNSFDIKTISGDINGKNLGKNNIKTVSGDIELGNLFDMSKISTTSGDISVDSINKSLNISSVSGEVSIDKINISSDSYISTVSGDVVIKMANDIYVETKSVSGDASIKNNNRKSDTILNVKTTSGDIDVN